MISREILSVMLDADGCIYNSLYHSLFLYIITKYGARLEAMAAKLGTRSHHAGQLESLINEIIKDIYQYKNKKLPIDNEELIAQLIINEGINPRFWAQEKLNIFIKETRADYRAIIESFGELGKRLFVALLYIANIELFNFVMFLMRTHRYAHLILQLGTNRQHFSGDLYNQSRNITGLFFADFLVVAGIFRHLFAEDKEIDNTVECSAEWFCLGDVANNIGAGAHYQSVVSHLSKKGSTIFPYHLGYFDETKFIINYPHLQRVAKQFQGYRVTSLVVDDREDILKTLDATFKKHHYAIPKGNKLQYCLYNGAPVVPRDPIIGTGVIDEYYSDTVLKLIKECPSIYQMNVAVQLSDEQIKTVMGGRKSIVKGSNLALGGQDSSNKLLAENARMFRSVDEKAVNNEPVKEDRYGCVMM